MRTSSGEQLSKWIPRFTCLLASEQKSLIEMTSQALPLPFLGV